MKIKFKPLEWECTDGPAIDMLNQLGCNAYVTYRKTDDGKLTYEAAFSDDYKRGFCRQEDAKMWVEKEFKDAVEWHLEDAEDVWKPIETAPKNGERIILRVGNIVGSGSFKNLSHYIECEKYFIFDGCSLPSGATHWMPLPEPPKECEK